ncbi:hypothetical protein GCM10009623_00600 [Nocardioides aestuarii]|uniref:DUF3060 domain-containing protein n=1 Tax=Nocardioides aestuarii TaxID=252231 RepID=A0ABW4THE7_9ACTN
MPCTTDRPGRVWLTGALAGAAVGGLLAVVAVVSSPAQAVGGIPTPCDDNVTLRLDDVTYDLQGTCGTVRVEADDTVVNLPATQKLVVLGHGNTVHGKTIDQLVVKGRGQRVEAASVRDADVASKHSTVAVDGLVEELLLARRGSTVTADQVTDAVVRGRGHALHARRGYDARVPGDANRVRYRRLDAVAVGGDDNRVVVRRGATQVRDAGSHNAIRVHRRG